VGAGWYMEGGGTFGGETLGNIAKMGSGEVYGVKRVLEDAPSEANVLILSNPQIAIAAVNEAGRTGRAGTADLRRMMMDIKELQTQLGPNPVAFGWGPSP